MGTLQTDVLLRQAQKAYADNKMDQAHNLCEQILRRDPKNAEVLFMLGQISFAQNRLDQAASYMVRAIDLQPANPVTHMGLGEIRTYQGRYEDAVRELDIVLRSDPDNAPALAGKADAYEKSGQRDKARALLRPFVEQGREHAILAVVQARLDLHDRDYDAVIKLVQRHVDRGEAKGYILWHLHHHLGQALERSKRFDEAFAAYQHGCSAVPTYFDPDSRQEGIDSLLESFTPQRFAGVPRASHGSQLPIFVLGMPRSGSTLVETILNAHPAAAAAGELSAMQDLVNSVTLDIGSTLPYPACIEDLDQNDVDTIAGKYLDRLRETDDQAQRIVDKYLNNYLHVGMLAVLFPQARIIHCRRHPLDTCFSCFQTPLPPATHPYSCDLRNLGIAYVAYDRLMAHWRDVLKIPMLEIQYEDLVADQEPLTRQIIDFCGLEWDDRCMRFYEGERVVLTASYDQVNRPIYSSSVGRYRNFEKHLGPLKEALAEAGCDDEMGSLHTDILLRQAQGAFAANQMDQARNLCDQILLSDKNNADAVGMLGRIALMKSRFDEAATHMLRAAALRPHDALAHHILGEIRTQQGRFDEAVAEYDKALRLAPEHPMAIEGKAAAYEKSGRRDKARTLLQKLSETGHESAKLTLIQARLDLHDGNYDAAVDVINRQLELGDDEGPILCHLHYCLGQALERAGRFDEAFAAYERSNRVIPTHFDPDSWAQKINDTIESFSSQRFANVPRASHGSELPVFVLGMPRSGSTLVETILDAHPAVSAAGELPTMQRIINSISLDIGSTLPYPACIEDLDSNDVDMIAGRYLDQLRATDDRAQRIVDKYLYNYAHLGMLPILFPQARIIHCRRHPLDTCFSCFQTPLPPATHTYSCDLGHLGAVYVAYERVMAHWRDVLKIPMLEVQYEALVSDQEGLMRRIIDFCGLNWDDRCLRFYEGERVVLTASAEQVNKPVYSSSVGRYRNFEKHLDPLKEALERAAPPG